MTLEVWTRRQYRTTNGIRPNDDFYRYILNVRLRWTAALVVAGTQLAVIGCGGDAASVDLSLPPFTPGLSLTDSATASNPTTTPESTTSPESGPTTELPEETVWEPAASNLAGLPSECGNLSFVTSHPARDMMVTGVALQGLHASTDGGDTWTPLGQGSKSDPITNRTSSIVFDPEVPTRFWESGTYNGGAVYRTDDDGSAFLRLGDARHADLVSVDFTDPARRTLLVGIHEQPTVLRSADGGTTWIDVSAGLPPGIGQATSPHVIDSMVHLLGTVTGPASGVYRTTDAGATWTLVRPGSVVGEPLVMDDTIWWLLEAGRGLISSTDDGATWTDHPASGKIHRYATRLIGLPDGRMATIGTGRIVLSEGGADWTPVGPPLPYSPNGLAYSPMRDAFYIWQFDCTAEDNEVRPDSILRAEGVLDG